MTTAKNNMKAIIELTDRFINNEISADQFNTQVLILEKV
jgi:hypothetical protein